MPVSPSTAGEPTIGLPVVSVVFVSYNRPHLLAATYHALLARVDYPRDRLELVLADDASDRWTRAVIDRLPFDRRVIAKKNGGLGANQNRGNHAASGDYILSLQDDCLLAGDPDFLRRAVAALDLHRDIGFLALIARPDLPVAEHRTSGQDRLALLGSVHDEAGMPKIFPYSDQPHLKRRDFHLRAGNYREGVAMTVMETEFGRRSALLPDIRFALIEGLAPFVHIGADHSFNPGNRRQRRIRRLESLPLLGPAFAYARMLVKRLVRRP